MKALIGANLKLFREAASYTQNHVAQFLGIDRGAYANYESGTREMPYDLMEKICELYGISLSSLFEEDPAVIASELCCAFRIETPSPEDISEISNFKNIVRNYLKMCDYQNG